MRGRGGAIKEEGLSVKCLRNGAPSMESVNFLNFRVVKVKVRL